jgi:hypothetical protein
MTAQQSQELNNLLARLVAFGAFVLVHFGLYGLFASWAMIYFAGLSVFKPEGKNEQTNSCHYSRD